MARKKKETPVELNTEILIGFVNSFNFNDPASEQALGGHPRVGRLYQLIKDKMYGYRLHIGADNNPARMAGILLGSDLVGNHDGKWSFDVAIITKQNFLNYDIHEEDTIKLGEWFSTNNAELQEAIKQDVKVVASDEDGNIVDAFDQILPEIFDEETETANEVKYNGFVDNINKLQEKDKQMFDCLVELTAYLASTYDDKYEGTKRPPLAKQFMLASNSPDVAIFNSMKYLQRYCTTGFEKSQNIKDLYKAVHYVLFELQRKKNNE